MAFLYADALFFVCIALITAVIHHSARSRSLPASLPPGPTGIPIFGNMLQIAPAKLHTKFREWALEYGKIFYLRLGPQPVIVLNTAEAADELLANRSNKYSSRATPHVAYDILSDGQRLAFKPYDKVWKTMRKCLQGAIGLNPSRRARKIQELESRVLLHDLLQYGDQTSLGSAVEGLHDMILDHHWFAFVRRYTTSVVLYIMYGQRVHQLRDNPQLHKIYDVLNNIAKMAEPGAYLADVFPILRALPDFLAPWRVHAQKMHLWQVHILLEMELWGGFLSSARDALRNGVVRSGFVDSYLRARAEAGHDDATGNGLTDDGWMCDRLVAYAAGGILEAGSDTTASTIQSFLLFMLSYPHVLHRVQEEINAVVGSSRLPTFEDEEKLPYLIACIKETLRCRPPAIMGIPHKVEEDDVYEGHFIPKGSTVIGNVWAIHMDPIRFPDPMVFKPERFYTEGDPTKWGGGPDALHRSHYAFGWGRRFCQGSYIAEASLFITLSRLIWGFNISALLDPKTGKTVVPDITDEANWCDGIITGPKLYGAKFTARSDRHADLIRKMYEDVQLEWQMMGLEGDNR
ncbi:uncharacterized protein FIBRA_09532 [Fibroporia radiculosa]|uniref:Cytochrome P450 n=1 Tax=Fibroporia radiculosa TaxID=599839 RepID=J7SCI2_9APHY|nr:uncharacterized protein FIBRA_09532 [Fibroporia radiculosa]CCM07191.1 predicted protein [Fibroporia radiculosa]